MPRTERFIVRLTLTERQALDELAAARERTRSALLRDLVLQARPQCPRVEMATEADRAGRRHEVAVPA